MRPWLAVMPLTFENGKIERTVVIEFPSIEAATRTS